MFIIYESFFESVRLPLQIICINRYPERTVCVCRFLQSIRPLTDWKKKLQLPPRGKAARRRFTPPSVCLTWPYNLAAVNSSQLKQSTAASTAVTTPAATAEKMIRPFITKGINKKNPMWRIRFRRQWICCLRKKMSERHLKNSGRKYPKWRTLKPTLTQW